MSGWRGPSYEGEFPSLGYGVVECIERNLKVPFGPMAGQPFQLTDEQYAFVVRAYRIDTRGRRVNRRAQFRRAKGVGKSPLAAALAIMEFCGPVKFGGWDADGEPIGIPEAVPLVWVAAKAEGQTDNTWRPLQIMLSDSPLVDELGIDVGKTRVCFNDSKRAGLIEFKTSDGDTREGPYVTCCILEETHLWTKSNRCWHLAEVISRNVAKANGISIEVTNAHVPGMGSWAEKTDDDSRRAGVRGVLVDTREGPDVPADADRETLLDALREAYGDAVPYVDLDRIADDYADTDPAVAARFFLNRLVASQGQAVSAMQLDLCEMTGSLAAGDQISLGFDGSKSRDSTALVATRIRDRLQVVLGYWERPKDVEEWIVPKAEVNAAVRGAFQRFTVLAMYCDPWWFQDELSEWSGQYPGLVFAFDTSKPSRIVWAVQRWREAIRTLELRWDGDTRYRDHVLAAQIMPTNVFDDRGSPMPKLGKASDSGPLIDIAMAAVLSYAACAKALEAGIPEQVESPYETRGMVML